MISTEPDRFTRWAFALCCSKKALRDVRKAGGHAAAVELGRGRDGAVLGHAHCQSAVADAQVEPVGQLGAAFGQQVAAGDAHVDGPLGTQHGNVLGAQKGDVDRHFAAAGEQAALLAAKAQAGLLEQLAGDFRQTAFAGDPDSQIIHGVPVGGCVDGPGEPPGD